MSVLVLQNYEAKHGAVVLIGYVLGDWLKLAAQECSTFTEEMKNMAAKIITVLGIMRRDLFV